MPEIEYQYAIDYFSEEGARLGSRLVAPDWGPARECAQFLAIRRGIVPPVLHDLAGTIEPVWDPNLGAPVLSAARVVVSTETGDDTVCEEISTSAYFRHQARKGSELLIEQGLLKKGDRYRFRICAYPAAKAESDPARDGSEDIDVEEVHETLPLDDQSMEPFLASATAWGAEAGPGQRRRFFTTNPKRPRRSMYKPAPACRRMTMDGPRLTAIWRRSGPVRRARAAGG